MNRRIVSLCVSMLLAILAISGCNGGSSNNSSASDLITVRTTPSSASMDAGTSENFTATLTNDTHSQGVAWAVSGGATLSNVTAVSATVTAPSAPGTFYVTASSVAQPSRKSMATVSVAAMPHIGSSAIPDAVIGKPYSYAIPETGGVPPYSWSVSAGTLPSGLGLDSASGTISGTATAPGPDSFTIQMHDSAAVPQGSTMPESMMVRTQLTVSSPAAPTALIGVPYSLSLSASGGATPYVWSVQSGSLPPGLLLNAAAGAVTGTATTPGNFSATLQVSDSTSPSQTATVVVSVSAAQNLAISTSSLFDATNGSAYTGSIATTGGTSPLTFSVSAGTLPAGLNLDATTGALSGTPTVNGTSNFTIHVADSSVPQQTANKSLSLRANAALVISSAALPTAALNIPYSASLLVNGGVNPLTFSISSGTLPAGLNLNATTGLVAGTPTAVGTNNFTAQVVDSANPARTVSLPLSIVVNSQFAVTSAPPPNAILAVPYIYTPTLSGGTAPFTWTISSGALPSGLIISSTTGIITGIPLAAGTSSFTLHVADSSNPALGASFPTSITVNSPLSILSTLLPNGVLGLPYVATVTAAGSVPPLTWSVSAGTLPAGLAINASTGVISGTPTSTGTTNFTLQVADSANPSRTATLASTIVVNPLLAINPITLPDAILGTLFNTTLTTTGGVGPFTWTVSGGTLPGGLALNASTGVITGIPTVGGNANFTVQVTDHSVPPQVKTLTTNLRVNSPLSILSTLLPNGVLGLPYATTLTAAGTVPPLTWSVSAGTLPAGLAINASTGVISGTPTGTGTTNFTLQVADSANPPRTATVASTIAVNPLLAINPITLPDAILGILFNTTLTSTGGVGPFTWTVSGGNLPNGLALNASTGVITGIPTLGGNANFTVQVTDHSVPPQVKTLTTNLNVNGVLDISSTTLPNAVAGLPYLATLGATGGTLPVTWTVSVGTLPAGLAINSATGIIAGVSTATGTVNFSLLATDSSHPAQTKTIAASIKTNTALSILPITLPDAIVNTLFNAPLSTSGGVGPVTWSISAGTLPAGLNINASTGVISGTPTGIAGPVSVTVQATDSSVPAQTATLALNLSLRGLLAITPVTLTPGLLGTNFSAALTATGGTGNYTWSISAGSLPSGIAIDGSTGVLSGTPLLAVLANFTVQVTDTGNPHQTATLALSLNITAAGVNNSLLTGNYAFMFNGFDASGAVGIAGSITANAAGSITAGVLDINRTSGVQTNLTVTSGIFAVNGDNRGTLTLTTSAGTQHFDIALNVLGTLGKIIEVEAPAAGVIRGSGFIKHQDSTAFSNAAITGHYAFGLSGSTTAGGRSAIIGSFVTNGAGGITSGLADANVAGTVSASKSVQNTSTYSVTGTGRGTLALNVASLTPVSGTIYVVSANEIIFLRTDAFNASHDLLAGELLQQTGAPFTALPLVGVSVAHVSGNASATTTSVGAGLIVSTGLGAIAATYDANDGGTITSTVATIGNHSITSASTGQGTMSFAGNHFLFYLVDSGTGFLMDATGSEVKTGMFEGQSVLPINLTSLAGNYVLGTTADTNSSVTFASGVLSLSALGAVSGATDTNASGSVVASGNLLSGTLSLLGGRITLGTTASYPVSPNRFIQIDLTGGKANAGLLVADK